MVALAHRGLNLQIKKSMMGDTPSRFVRAFITGTMGRIVAVKRKNMATGTTASAQRASNTTRDAYAPPDRASQRHPSPQQPSTRVVRAATRRALWWRRPQVARRVSCGGAGQIGEGLGEGMGVIMTLRALQEAAREGAQSATPSTVPAWVASTKRMHNRTGHCPALWVSSS